MDLEQQKLDAFRRLVLSDAEKARDQVLHQLEQERTRRLEEKRTQLTQVYDKKHRREQERIFQEQRQQVAQRQAEYKKQLLSTREQIIDDIFNQVRHLLLEHTKTQEYADRAVGQIKTLLPKLPGPFVAVVQQDDTLLQQALTKQGYSVEVTDEIFYGGCRLKVLGSNVQIDLTNRTKLQQERDNFLETYQLKN